MKLPRAMLISAVVITVTVALWIGIAIVSIHFIRKYW